MLASHKKKKTWNVKLIHIPEQVASNPVSQHVLDRAKEPQWDPERWCGQSCAVIADKHELENRGRHLRPPAVSLISYQIANEPLIKAVVETLRLSPHLEN
jgi:hypothetical protein